MSGKELYEAYWDHLASHVFWDFEGKERCLESVALQMLLMNREFLITGLEVVEPPWPGEVRESPKIGPETVTLSVICSDIFAWGCCDDEPLPESEIPRLLKMVIANRKWGSIQWCCLRRNEQPQTPIKRDMQADGAWTDELEALPANYYDTAMAAKEPPQTA